jgi:hypothetical protein
MCDDFLQGVKKQGNDAVECSEFITLNSTTDYVLPMADLKDKGLKFTSPLLLYSTNLNREQAEMSLKFSLMNSEAILRRMPFYLEFSKTRKRWEFWSYQTDLKGVILWASTDWHDCAIRVKNFFLKEWSRKSRFYLKTFSSLEEQIPCSSNTYLRANTEFNSDNTVSVSPVIEPLKVRIITIGSAQNFVLKPLQKAMSKALDQYKIFKPCFTPNYDSIIEGFEKVEGTYLSGDYSSATDGLHSDLFRAGINKLCSSLPVSLREAVQREAAPHLCKYPKWADIEDTWQTNGQLMGSLLSFPYLCLINAFTVSQSQMVSLLKNLKIALFTVMICYGKHPNRTSMNGNLFVLKSDWNSVLERIILAMTGGLLTPKSFIKESELVLENSNVINK